MNNKLNNTAVEFNTDDCYVVNEKLQVVTFCMIAQTSSV